MIENVIFDLGNVLINYDFELFFNRLGYKQGRRSLQEAHKEIFDFECGKMEEASFLFRLAEIYQSPLSRKDFKEAWCDVFWQNTRLLEFAKTLKDKFRVMILSNNDELHFPYIWKKFPLLHFFEERNIMITSRLGYIKPQKELYEEACRIHNFDWNKSVFIDDNKSNLIVPDQKGAVTVFHQDNTITIKDLKKILGYI